MSDIKLKDALGDEHVYTDVVKMSVPAATDSGVVLYTDDNELATVAHTGEYNDLLNKPDLTVYRTSAEQDVIDGTKASTSYVDTELATKQDVLTWDDTPTPSSNNPVKSGGIYLADQAIRNSIGGLGNAVGMKGWNQLIEPFSFSNTWGGVTFTATKGRLVANGAVTSNVEQIVHPATIISGHKYFFATPKKYTNGFWEIYPERFSTRTASRNDKECILEATSSGYANIYIRAYTSTPNIDIDGYYQYIDLTVLFGAGNEPTTVADFRAMFPAEYYPYCNGSFGDLLWTNASPTSEFVAQTLDIDSSGYTALLIQFKEYANYFDGSAFLILQGIETPAYAFKAGVIVNRYVKSINNAAIQFWDGRIYNTYNVATTDNTVRIPYKIYGIR